MYQTKYARSNWNLIASVLEAKRLLIIPFVCVYVLSIEKLNGKFVHFSQKNQLNCDPKIPKWNCSHDIESMNCDCDCQGPALIDTNCNIQMSLWLSLI